MWVPTFRWQSIICAPPQPEESGEQWWWWHPCPQNLLPRASLSSCLSKSLLSPPVKIIPLKKKKPFKIHAICIPWLISKWTICAFLWLVNWKTGSELKKKYLVLLWLLPKCPLEDFTHAGSVKKKDNDKLKGVQRSKVIKCLENKVCQKRWN